MRICLQVPARYYVSGRAIAYEPLLIRCPMTSIADTTIAGRPRAESVATAEATAATAAPAITLPAVSERELRLDLFRGLALWLIFVDHLPTNILTWFTIRNYGFSDATEI